MRRGAGGGLLRTHAVLETLHPLLHRHLLQDQRVDLRLRLARHGLQVLMRLLLRDELLDHLVDVRHARRLLDLLERRLVRGDLLLLLLNISLRDRVLRRPLAPRVIVVQPRGLLHRLASRLLPPLELGVDLLLLGDEQTPLGQLLLAQLALLTHQRLELGELELGHLFGLVGVVRHEQQLLVVRLLLREGLLEGLHLSREAQLLVLQPLDHLLVRHLRAVLLVVPGGGLLKLHFRVAQPLLRRLSV
mmetsp:Transcript_35454/g.81140  ORF Transcript_35454/g.81140 Transcript_35454/m.81140 type:complete len:246 (-) Transcript_35454:245-982(-)